MDETTEKRAKSKGGRPPLHGGFSLLHKGELPKNRRYLRSYLTGVREQLIRDLGPTDDDLTGAQRILIDRVTTLLGCVRCVEEHLRQKGIFDNPGGFLSPSLSDKYLAWNRAIKEILALLGVDKRVSKDNAPSLTSIAAEYDRTPQDSPPLAQDDDRNAQDGRSARDEGSGQGKEAITMEESKHGNQV